MSGHTDNSVEIDAPPALTFEIANDLARWPELFAGEYASVEVLEQGPGRVRFRLTTEPHPDGQVFSWVSERFADAAAMTVTARRVETGPFTYMHIFQMVTPAPGGGSVLRWVQDFEAREGAPFTDQEMSGHIDESSAENLLRHKQVIEAAAGLTAPLAGSARGA
jgi:aromatase